MGTASFFHRSYEGHLQSFRIPSTGPPSLHPLLTSHLNPIIPHHTNKIEVKTSALPHAPCPLSERLLSPCAPTGAGGVPRRALVVLDAPALLPHVPRRARALLACVSVQAAEGVRWAGPERGGERDLLYCAALCERGWTGGVYAS